MIFKVLHSIWVEVWYPRIDITLEFNIFGVWTFFRPTLEKEQSENKTLVANKYLHNRLFWRLSVNLRNSKTQWRNRYPFFLKVHLELCAKKKKRGDTNIHLIIEPVKSKQKKVWNIEWSHSTCF